MEMKPVRSSNIKAIGYEPETQRLHVQFGSGKTYEYEEFPFEQHAALIGAPSIGSHFARHVRSIYKGAEVRDGQE